MLQPLALGGGEDAETLAVAEKRIPALLRHRDRAVTEEDYRRLSFEAPSIDVGRVEVLPRFKPRDRRFNVPGVVSVMALPAAPLARRPIRAPTGRSSSACMPISPCARRWRPSST